MRTAATIATTYAILEIAQNVIGVGTGFVKMDMTGRDSNGGSLN